MDDSQKSILPDRQEQFAETFEYVTDLINQDELVEAVKILSTLHYADLADFLDNTNHKSYKKILPLLADNIKAETLEWLNNSSKQPAIEAIGIKRSAELIELLDLEDAIEVIENVDNDVKQALLASLSSNKQHQIIEGFTYPENTVGRVVEKQFISFQENWTVGQAINYIRSSYLTKDHHAAIVIDNKSRPVGNILLSTLLKYQNDKLVKELMNSEFKIADTYTELSEIAFIFKQYALTIVPVVNKSGKLVGTISIDNMIYIIEEQSEKDIMSLGGIHTQDTFYDLFSTAKHRFPWLFVNLISACLTSIIINQFSTTISKLITLAAIMPIVASMGGNAGTQAMTVTILALANKDINNANMFKVIAKEILVSGFNGFFLGCIGAGLSFAMLADSDLSIIFAVAIMINFLVSGFCGSVIPITLHNFNIDPAIASGVFLTALTDSLGFFTFLTLAYFFLV